MRSLLIHTRVDAAVGEPGLADEGRREARDGGDPVVTRVGRIADGARAERIRRRRAEARVEDLEASSTGVAERNEGVRKCPREEAATVDAVERS